MMINIISVIIIILIAIVIYNIIDNRRIKLIKQDVVINKLPKSFEDFKILQISDLHGKSFGKDQERLIKKINSTNYDIVAITGDMGSKHTKDIEPFIKLLNGIKNKKNIYFESGNEGPEAIIRKIDQNTRKIFYESTEIGNFLVNKGCNILEKPYSIKRGEDILWISKILNKDMFDFLEGNSKNRDVKIAISHYPMNRKFYEKIASSILKDYDLILTGHYHGGQYRIPLLGAIFIPRANGEKCWFPKQREVSGLNVYGKFNEYISRGLGASSNFKFLEFRLFNTPELNLITLKTNKEEN